MGDNTALKLIIIRFVIIVINFSSQFVHEILQLGIVFYERSIYRCNFDPTNQSP